MPRPSHLGCGLWMFPSELTAVVMGTVSPLVPSANFLPFASKLVGYPSNPRDPSLHAHEAGTHPCSQTQA